MRFLHTMLRVRNLDTALHFYCNLLGLREVRRRDDEKGRYTLVFLAAPQDEDQARKGEAQFGRGAPVIELTYNWDTEDYGEARYFGHLAFEVEDATYPLDADAGRRQVGDRPQQLDVAHRVTAAAAHRASGADQPDPVVAAQGLGVQAGGHGGRVACRVGGDPAAGGPGRAARRHREGLE